MKKEDFLAAFAKLSPREQEAVRAELLAKGASETAGQTCGCNDAMKAQLCEMMEKMQQSDNPMAMCSEMMQMCHEKMKDKCCQ